MTPFNLTCCYYHCLNGSLLGSELYIIMLPLIFSHLYELPLQIVKLTWEKVQR